MANLNFILKEEDWYESQPVQLSTGKFAISINFGDAANNRVVYIKVLMERIMCLTKQHLVSESFVI